MRDKGTSASAGRQEATGSPARSHPSLCRLVGRRRAAWRQHGGRTSAELRGPRGLPWRCTCRNLRVQTPSHPRKPRRHQAPRRQARRTPLRGAGITPRLPTAAHRRAPCVRARTTGTGALRTRHFTRDGRLPRTSSYARASLSRSPLSSAQPQRPPGVLSLGLSWGYARGWCVG